MRIGVISDTHGLVRPEAIAALTGSEHVLHAGDVGRPEVLSALEALAPLTVVRGNNDVGAWAEHLPETARVVLGGVRFLVVHDVKTLNAIPEDVDVVVAGHSHRPVVEQLGPVLLINPGSAGPRRFRLPVAVARILVEAGRARAEIVEIA